MSSKGSYFIVVLLFAGLISNAQNITFSGRANKKYDGNKIVLYNRITGDHDSTYLKDGKFVFTVTFKEPTRYYFYSDFERKAKGGYIPTGVIVTKPCTIKIDADIENFHDSKFKGSKEDELYSSFSAETNKAQKKIIDDLTQKYGDTLVNSRKPDTADIRYKQMMEEYTKLSEASQKTAFERLNEFIKANPGSFAAIYLLDGYATRMELSELETSYELISPIYKNTRQGTSIAKVIEARKITAIGKSAPDFAQTDTSGGTVKLSDFRGKYVLVDFWASWCGPCRAENPNLVKTFNRYKDKGFTVLGVSLDQPGKKDAWLAAIHKDNLIWTQVSDLEFWDNEVAILYGIKSIPSNLLLDREGKIIGKDLRGSDLEKKLTELFGN
jgi:peroxiredoxin